jgi:hypothetical protein
VASKKKLKRRLKWATAALERAATVIAESLNAQPGSPVRVVSFNPFASEGGEWEPRQGDELEQISTRLRGILHRNLIGGGWQVRRWGSTRSGGWWETTEDLLNDPDIRVVHGGPQKAPDIVSRFLPLDTPPMLRKDVEAALEGLLEASRAYSATRRSEELLRMAAKVGGLIRSAHGAPVADCICNETTYGKACPIHGEHWAVREADWRPEHGMALVSFEKATKGTLLRVDPLPQSPIRWHVLVKTDPMIVYPFSSEEDLKKSWRPVSDRDD